MPLEIGPSNGIMECGRVRLGPGLQNGPSGQGSGFTKSPNQGLYKGHGRGQMSKHGSALSSRLSHRQQYKQAHTQNQQKHTSYLHSPQHSFNSGSQSGNSSSLPS